MALKQINADHIIFVTSLAIDSPIIRMFVDNIKIMGVKRLGHIKRVKKKCVAVFEMIDMGPISFYLSLKVEKNHQKKMLKLFQLAYIHKILSKYHLDLAKSCNRPMKEAILLSIKGFNTTQAEQERYKSISGLLIFLMVETRLNIAFGTSVVSSFAKNPF